MGPAGRSAHREILYRVRCSCGTEKIVALPHLVSGSTVSCGCYLREKVLANRLIDLTGRRFGRLLVLSRAPKVPGEKPKWNVVCACGTCTVVLGARLVGGVTRSCGCLRKEILSRPKINLLGQRFGKLLVVARAANRGNQIHYWEVLCDCGSRKVVCGRNLLTKSTRSCGCNSKTAISIFAKTRIGSLNPNWNPRLTQKDRDRNRLGTPTQKRWAASSQQVRRRDHATCLVCGAPNSTHVHHLEPWATYRDLRYNPANLVTLCKECHNQFHQLYGNDCDLNDFEEFLKP